jgi:nucleotide-binding universal stress UspA family protein
METYTHVAVAVEDSPGSRKALEEGARIASLCSARLSVLHATSIPMPPPNMAEGGVFLPDPEVMQHAALEAQQVAREMMMAVERGELSADSEEV